MMKSHFFCVLGITFIVFVVQPVYSQPAIPEFGSILPVTDSDRASQLSRSPDGSFQFDSNGNLHLVYTEQNTEGTGLGTPGLMLYTVRSNGSFSPPLAIRSEVGDGVPFNSGGNPALALQNDGTVHFIWHDYRHSTSASGTNQLEIYYRKLLPNGQFAGEEIRLSDNSGNSWRPKIVWTPDGRLVASWYDFSQNSLGNLLMARSDSNQAFSSPIDFDSQVISSASPNGEGVITSQIAADSQGQLHFVWTVAELSGFFFQNEKPVYGTMQSSDDPTITQRQSISERGTSSTDPAKLTVDGNDTVWAVWTNFANDIPNIHLASKSSGSETFDAAIPITENDLPDAVEQADVAVAPDGTVYVVWVDFRTGSGDIYLRAYDPSTQSLSERSQLTQDEFNVDEKPGIEISPNGQIAVLWESDVDGRVNLNMLQTESTSFVPAWMLYQ